MARADSGERSWDRGAVGEKGGDRPVVVDHRVEDVVEEVWIFRREVARVDLIQALLQFHITVVIVHGCVAVAHKHRATST